MFSRNAVSGPSKSRRRRVVLARPRCARRPQAPEHREPTFTYYPDGHVATEVAHDGLGHQFNESFNQAGSVTKAVVTNEADGSLVSDATYSYDANNTLRNREIVTADGTDSTWSFRANGTASASMQVKADGTQRIDTYNAAGSVTNSLTTDGDGNFVSVTTETYYADGHLKSFKVSNADGSGYSYGWADTSGNAEVVNSVSTTDSSGTTHAFAKQDNGWWT